MKSLLKQDKSITKLEQYLKKTVPAPITIRNVVPIPAPRKSVRQKVPEYEENIISPPLAFRDGYKPIPKPRTIKKGCATCNYLNSNHRETKALKGYTNSFEISIRNETSPLKQNTETRKAIQYKLAQEMQQMKSLKFVETWSITFEKMTQDGPTTKTAYFYRSQKRSSM